MSAYFSVFSVRYLRPAALLCLTAAALCLGDFAHASGSAELYQATAPVADRSVAAQPAAFQAAMQIVLVRVTGRRSTEDDPALAPLLSDARRYVQQYRYTADNQLWVAFDGAAIERWLTQNGQPLWGHERPTTFVWLAVQTGPQSGTVITAEDTSELKTAIDAAAALRGVPLIWPSAADLQKNHLDYTAANGVAPAVIADIGHRLGGEGTLIGRATGSSAAAGVRWTHLFRDHSSEFSGTLEGVNRAADLYASLFAASGTMVPIDIDVTGINDLHDYAGVQTYLESLSFVSHLSVQSLTGDTIRFRLTTRGGIEALRRALSLNGPLQPAAAAAAAGDNGIQRFELRH